MYDELRDFPGDPLTNFKEKYDETLAENKE